MLAGRTLILQLFMLMLAEEMAWIVPMRRVGCLREHDSGVAPRSRERARHERSRSEPMPLQDDTSAALQCSKYTGLQARCASIHDVQLCAGGCCLSSVLRCPNPDATFWARPCLSFVTHDDQSSVLRRPNPDATFWARPCLSFVTHDDQSLIQDDSSGFLVCWCCWLRAPLCQFALTGSASYPGGDANITCGATD